MSFINAFNRGKRKNLLFIFGAALIFAGISVIYTGNTYKDYTPVSAVITDSSYDMSEEEYTYTVKWKAKDNTERTKTFTDQKKLPDSNASDEITLWISPDETKASVQSASVLIQRGGICIALGIILLIVQVIIKKVRA